MTIPGALRVLALTWERTGVRALRALAAAALLLPVLILAAACSGGETTAKAPTGPGGASSAGSPSTAATPVAARKVPVSVEIVAPHPVSYTIQAVGSLLAQEIVRVPARVAGVVDEITFQEGRTVSPNSVLARIDTERYRLSRARAEANWQQAEAQSRQVQAALDKRRALRAKDPGWVSEEELSNYSAQLDQAKAAAAAAKAFYDLATKDATDSEVHAATSGIINEKLVDTGQYVTAGTAIATIADTRRLKLTFKVAQSESVRLTESSPVAFRVQAVPGQEFRAKLYHIGEVAGAGTRQVECLAWVENPGTSLRPGFFADVTATVEERTGSLVVPQTAVIPTDQGFVGFVLKGDDGVERRVLRLGLYTRDGGVEVLEGLAAGDRVVTRGAASLSEGSRIVLVSARSGATADGLAAGNPAASGGSSAGGGAR